MANRTISLMLTPHQQALLLETWAEYRTGKTPQYARFQLRLENCVITCYNSGKTVFQGNDAEVYASPFQQAQKETIFPQAGSDEVGTGDYFGPVCVAAALVTETTISLLEELGIRDSKALNDKKIRKAAAVLQNTVPYTILVVPPAKYNTVHQTCNMNAIKAKLHNQAYINLRKKQALPSFLVIDQFAEEPVYYHYLKDTDTVIRGIHFETKAEDKYPAVAAASVIARNTFLTYMDEMEKHYDMTFPKGGGNQADEAAVLFCRKYGSERLGEVAKLHFRNTERVLEQLG